jgi:hypothetical protein
MALTTLDKSLIAVFVVTLVITLIMIFMLFVPRWAYYKIKNHPRLARKSHSQPQETKAWWTEGMDALTNLKTDMARKREERRLEMEKLEFEDDLEKAEEQTSKRMSRPVAAFLAARDRYDRKGFEG